MRVYMYVCVHMYLHVCLSGKDLVRCFFPASSASIAMAGNDGGADMMMLLMVWVGRVISMLMVMTMNGPCQTENPAVKECTSNRVRFPNMVEGEFRALDPRF